MKPRALYDIQTSADYDAALAELRRLWGASEGTEASEARDLLAAAIARYEETAYPSGPVTPLDIVRFHLEARGRDGRKELDALLGGPSRTSEILNGRRRLTQKMIVALHRAWNIPYELLLEDSTAMPVPPTSLTLPTEIRAGIEEAVRQAVTATVPGVVASAVRSVLAEAGVKVSGT